MSMYDSQTALIANYINPIIGDTNILATLFGKNILRTLLSVFGVYGMGYQWTGGEKK